MDGKKKNPPVIQKAQKNTQQANNTCPLYFSWDMLFYHTFFVALYLLVFRLFFTFFFAFIFVQQWHIEKMWGWFPIVAFNSDIETFTKMNSYAVVVSGALVLCFFIFQVFAHYQQQRQYKIYAWYLGVIMLLVQYLILIAINYRIRFSINTHLWFVFIAYSIIASILLYLWLKYIRQWKLAQYVKRQKTIMRGIKRKFILEKAKQKNK